MATDRKLSQVSSLTDFDYALIVKGDEVAKISKADLSSVIAGVMDTVNNVFYTDTINGNYSMGQPIEVVKETVNHITAKFPSKVVTFRVIHNKQGYRELYGFLYPGGSYGVVTVRPSDGYVRTYLINNFEYTERQDNFGYNSLADLAGGVAEQMNSQSLFSINYLGNLRDNNLEDVGSGFGYAFATSDGSDINGIFLSLVADGYKFQIKADSTQVGRIKYRMYHASNQTWSAWTSLT